MKHKELGRKVLKQITEHPETFDMDTFAFTDEGVTAACIAGWTLLLSGYTLDGWDIFHRPNGEELYDEAYEAGDLLGLSDDELYPEEIGAFFSATEEDAINHLRKLVEEA